MAQEQPRRKAETRRTDRGTAVCEPGSMLKRRHLSVGTRGRAFTLQARVVSSHSNSEHGKGREAGYADAAADPKPRWKSAPARMLRSTLRHDFGRIQRLEDRVNEACALSFSHDERERIRRMTRRLEPKNALARVHLDRFSIQAPLAVRAIYRERSALHVRPVNAPDTQRQGRDAGTQFGQPRATLALHGDRTYGARTAGEASSTGEQLRRIAINLRLLE